LEAFEYYYGLGANRSYRQVAKKFQVHHQTVVYWAKRNHWQDKIIERNATLAAQLEEATTSHVIGVKINYSHFIAQCVRDFIKYVDDMKKLRKAAIKENREALERREKGVKKLTNKDLAAYSVIKNVHELELVIKLQLLLLGEATERKEQSIEHEDRQLDKLLETDEQARSLIKDIYRKSKIIPFTSKS